MKVGPALCAGTAQGQGQLVHMVLYIVVFTLPMHSHLPLTLHTASKHAVGSNGKRVSMTTRRPQDNRNEKGLEQRQV